MTEPHRWEVPSAPLPLAVLQTEAIPGDLLGNARRAAGMVSRAARRGARVAVLPELHLCGYDLPTLQADPEGCEITTEVAGAVTDPRLEPLVEEAVRSRTAVLVGAAVRRLDGALVNCLLAVEPPGTVSVVYEKRHLWHADESRIFTAGTGGDGLLEVGGWRLGLAICYDMSFAAHAGAAALSGAHAYLCPSAFVVGAERRAAVYMPARALENTVYSVYANAVGGPADRPAGGASAVYAPDGRLVGGAGTEGEEIVVSELDPERIAQVRGFLHMLAERASAAEAV
ncbi:carbon-nitrogen hydrolase family protein [Streptomyces sp. TP-A0874]|uniref:carbon-nitrogen hydrolase family protein n=1 Tax=Streptomyces sp. TP-A0874 TaxID=549819 RepID=UPI000853C429|nr:carbon-nitrogen hydrolase family protein [Streptomyces sp. TP-A0874]